MVQEQACVVRDDPPPQPHPAHITPAPPACEASVVDGRGSRVVGGRHAAALGAWVAWWGGVWGGGHVECDNRDTVLGHAVSVGGVVVLPCCQAGRQLGGVVG